MTVGLTIIGNSVTCIEANYIPYQHDMWMGRGSAIVFAPHPDDEVFGCAGAIMQHLVEGDRVKVIVVTDGAFSESARDEEYVRIRESESRLAAEILGAEPPEFWGYKDRGLVADDELVEKISQEIKEFTAHYVYSPSWWEVHPDHTALSWAVTKAMQSNASSAELLLYEVGVPMPPNRLLDITQTAKRKRLAMNAFKSQLSSQRYDRQIMALNRFRSYTLGPEVSYAEAYRSVDMNQMDLREQGSSLSLKLAARAPISV